jgi:ankyrin repeat protein
VADTPLEKAALSGDLARVRELVDSERASIDSAMCFAVIGWHAPVARFLLEHGANANATFGYGRTALFYAVTATTELVELLLEFGAEVNVRDEAGYDVLNAYLTSKGPGPNLGKANPFVVKHLVEKGLRVRNDAKQAHLLGGISTGNVRIVELLLEHGADPNVKEVLWTTFICSNRAPMLAALVNGGIDPNAHEKNAAMDTTILTEVCAAGDQKSAKALLDRGADPNAKGRSSPLAAAMESGNQVLVDLLLERGARPLIAPLPAEATKALDLADRQTKEKPDDGQARLSRAKTLHEQGSRAAAAFEAQALRKRGMEVPKELSAFGRWTYVDFPPRDGVAPRTIDERFPNAWVTDGTRTVPLVLTMAAECTSCDEKGETVCSKCDGKGSYSSFLDPDHDVDCEPRQRCYSCRGLKFQVTGKRFSKGSCSHPNVVDEPDVGNYGFKRCETCGLAALHGELVTHYGQGVDWACGVCSRFACTCEFAR